MKQALSQQHDLGCGLACVAFIADAPYGKVAEILGGEKADTNGFTCKELVTALSKLGLEYNYKYIKPYLRQSIYKDGTIVFIKRSSKYPYGHYLTRFQGKWMDSWVNLPFDKNIKNAKSGFRKRLPGKPIYMVYPA
jgi:hypothetical protein